MRDRAAGILVGLAAGDRNGGPVRLALRLAESLLERRRFDGDDVFARYLAWWREGAFDTGPVFAAVMEQVMRGTPRADAVRMAHERLGGRTAGCNPAHRVAPLAAAGFLPDAELPRLAMAEAALTHHDPLAGDVSAAAVCLGRSLVRGLAWEDAVAGAARGRRGPTLGALEREGETRLRRGGFAPDVLRAAAHFVGRASSADEALEESLAFAGAPNYCPVLVGALAGARWGASAISTRHLSHVGRLLPRVHQAAEGLAGTWPASAEGGP